MKIISHVFESIIFLVLIIITALMPFFVLYLFSDIMFLLLYHIIGYRKKTAFNNLQQIFPEKSPAEIKILLKETYQNLTDVIVESIKSFSMTKNQVRKRHKVINPEILENDFIQGRSIIAVTGHYGNWEWGSLSAGLYIKHLPVAFYKPLSNRFIDYLIRKSRARFGTVMASIKETTVTFQKYKNCPAVFLMAADQNPSKPDQSYWIKFLGKPTAFLHGPEKHARLNHLPVYYVDIQRIKRGFYLNTIILLTHDPEQFESGEITLCFARQLESVIQKNPANWLWTHRRWKHKPSDNQFIMQ